MCPKGINNQKKMNLIMIERFEKKSQKSSAFGRFFSDLHPGRLTWNLQITHLERKMIFQTSMILFHVNLPGCISQILVPVELSGLLQRARTRLHQPSEPRQLHSVRRRRTYRFLALREAKRKRWMWETGGWCIVFNWKVRLFVCI